MFRRTTAQKPLSPSVHAGCIQHMCKAIGHYCCCGGDQFLIRFPLKLSINKLSSRGTSSESCDFLPSSTVNNNIISIFCWGAFNQRISFGPPLFPLTPFLRLLLLLH